MINLAIKRHHHRPLLTPWDMTSWQTFSNWVICCAHTRLCASRNLFFSADDSRFQVEPMARFFLPFTLPGLRQCFSESNGKPHQSKYCLVIKFLIAIENIIVDLMTIVMPGWCCRAPVCCSPPQLTSIKANAIINFHFKPRHDEMDAQWSGRRRRIDVTEEVPVMRVADDKNNLALSHSTVIYELRLVCQFSRMPKHEMRDISSAVGHESRSYCWWRTWRWCK